MDEEPDTNYRTGIVRVKGNLLRSKDEEACGIKIMNMGIKTFRSMVRKKAGENKGTRTISTIGTG